MLLPPSISGKDLNSVSLALENTKIQILKYCFY